MSSIELSDILAKTCMEAAEVIALYDNIPKPRVDAILRQITLFHDPDEWDKNDLPLNMNSFRHLLKWLSSTKPDPYPGLGLGITGNILGVWMRGSDRIYIEVLPNGFVKWSIDIFNVMSSGTMPISELDQSYITFTPT